MGTLQQSQSQCVIPGRPRRRLFTHRIHHKKVTRTSRKQFSVRVHSGGTPGAFEEWNAHVCCLKSMLIQRAVSWQDSTVVAERKLSPNQTEPASNRKMPPTPMVASVVPSS